LVQGAPGIARLFDYVDAVTIVNLEILAFIKAS